MHRGGGSENRRGLTFERSVQPQLGSRVPERLQRRGHVAEAGRRTERESCAFREVGELHVRRATFRHRRRASFGHRRHWRHGAKARPRAGDLLDAAREELRHLFYRAVPAVVQDQDIARHFRSVIEGYYMNEAMRKD
jgi:hypothetical protein